MAGQANLVAGVAFFVQLLVAPITVNADGRRADHYLRRRGQSSQARSE